MINSWAIPPNKCSSPSNIRNWSQKKDMKKKHTVFLCHFFYEALCHACLSHRWKVQTSVIQNHRKGARSLMTQLSQTFVFENFEPKKSGENWCWLCIFETCLMSALVSKHHWIAIRHKLGTRCQAALRLARRTCWWISFRSLWNPLFR